MIIDKIAWQSQCSDTVDVRASFAGISEKQLAGKGQEIQCKIIIDGEDNYENQQAYYCDMSEGLSTTIKTDANTDHEIELCCGVEGLEQGLVCKSKKLQGCGIEI